MQIRQQSRCTPTTTNKSPIMNQPTGLSKLIGIPTAPGSRDTSRTIVPIAIPQPPSLDQTKHGQSRT